MKFSSYQIIVGFVLTMLVSYTTADVCDISTAFEVGKVEQKELDEASGIIASRTQRGVLWSHNDHGDDARIFALSETGEDLGIWNLKGIVHNDFEDISQGKGPTPGVNYIYLGDIGNNHYDREEIFVYRFPEPDISLTSSKHEVDDIEKFTIINPHGSGEDIETLMMDPITDQIYLLTKNHEQPIAYIYKFTPPLHRINADEQVIITLEEVGHIPNEMLVAGDISIDGTKILLRQAHSEGAWMWKRTQDQTVEDSLMKSESCDLLLEEEQQGEAIAVDATGLGFYTTSEGKHQPIYYYEFA